MKIKIESLINKVFSESDIFKGKFKNYKLNFRGRGLEIFEKFTVVL